MFSKIPMPRADWTKENMKYMFCFFPFIGTVIGGLTMLVAYLGLRFGYQPGFVTAVLVLVPVFATGGIHVDGLLDTSDALSSWQERSRRLEILKDSHAGAFAVITAAVYFIAWYGAYSQLFNGAENMMGIETMKNVSPKTVDRSTLVQISSIRLDPAAPREDRLREFIKQIRNPYCYLDGKTVVKISFTETDTTMEDCLEHYLRGL